MKRYFIVATMLIIVLGNRCYGQCDATFIPSFFKPVTGQPVNFFYWGGIPYNSAWGYTLNYGNSTSTTVASGALTNNNLGSATYSTAGSYTVTLTVTSVSCTTSYSLNLVVANATGGCSTPTLTNDADVSICVGVEGVLSVSLVAPGTYPLDHIVWDMGDGNTVTTTTTSIAYTYDYAGVYFVTANVFVHDGSTLCQRYAVGQTDGPINVGYYIVSVNDGDPELSMSPAVPVVGNTVTFTYTGDYSVLPPYYINPWQYRVSLNGGVSWTAYAPLVYGQTLVPTMPSILAGPHNYKLEVLNLGSSNLCRQDKTLSFTVNPSVCDTCNSFKPTPGKEYWMSAWVQVGNGTTQVPTYSDASISFDFVGTSTTTVTFLPSGEIIDGWQRIVGKFTIPVGTLDLEVNLNAGNSTTYFDDIRIHPFNGSMKSYVYDGQTFWLVSELDDNNYATFYEYDAEGGLIRIKKETARGIVTIQETRSNTVKN